MPRSSGTMSLPAGQPVVNGTVIDATVFNTLTTDIANEITNSLPRDGTAPPTANLPMGNFKITGLGNGTVATDAMAFGQIPTSYNATAIVNTPAGNIAATTVQAALNELDAEKAKIGANSDITSLTGLTTPLSVAQGGTGSATHTLNSLLLGNGTSALLEVAPSTSGNILKSNGTTWQSIASPSALTSGTAVASTSGTSIDFTGIPSTAKRITIMFNGVSTNGASPLLIQIGAGTIVTTGYVSTASVIGAASVASSAYTAGFGIRYILASYTMSGFFTLTLVSGNIWVISGAVAEPISPATYVTAGNVTLSGTLDRVRITTVNGTDTFDAGSINIMWE